MCWVSSRAEGSSKISRYIHLWEAYIKYRRHQCHLFCYTVLSYPEWKLYCTSYKLCFKRSTHGNICTRDIREGVGGCDRINLHIFQTMEQQIGPATCRTSSPHWRPHLSQMDRAQTGNKKCAINRILLCDICFSLSAEDMETRWAQRRRDQPWQWHHKGLCVCMCVVYVWSVHMCVVCVCVHTCEGRTNTRLASNHIARYYLANSER